MENGIEAREFTLKATVKGVFIGNKDSLITTAIEKAQVIWDGFRGDKHAGRTRFADTREDDNFFPRGCEIVNLRQFSAVSVEELQQIAIALGVMEVKAEWLGANLLFEGIPAFSSLPSGTHLFFDRYAVLVVAGENGPCRNPGEVVQNYYPHYAGLAASFVKCALGKRGVIGFVKRPGIVRNNSSVIVKVPKQALYAPNVSKSEFEHEEAKRKMPTAEEAKRLFKEFAKKY